MQGVKNMVDRVLFLLHETQESCMRRKTITAGGHNFAQMFPRLEAGKKKIEIRKEEHQEKVIGRFEFNSAF